MSPIDYSVRGRAFVVLSIMVLTTLLVAGVQFAGEGNSTTTPSYTLELVPGSGSFTVSGYASLEGNSYTCNDGSVITVSYDPLQTATCISNWGYRDTVDPGVSEGSSEEGIVTTSSGVPTKNNISIMKETAFTLMFTLTGDVTISPSIPTEGVVKVTTWSELVSQASNSTVNTIIIDTNHSLSPIGTERLVINHSLNIVGDNSSGKNGFYRTDVTKVNEVEVSTVHIKSGCVVSVSGVTFDGGAKWPDKNPGATGVTKIAQDTLQRGVVDGASFKPQEQFILNEGNLNLRDESIIQNACNNYSDPDATNNGGAICNLGSLSLDGVLIKDCFAIRGAAVYSWEGSTTYIGGNTIITHNGGMECQLGSAIYAAKNTSLGNKCLVIDGGKINENYGSFTLASYAGMIMNGGEILNNVSVPAKASKCSSQDTHCGVLYSFGDPSKVEMTGGIITGNKTLRISTAMDDASVGGKFNGIVFQKTSTFKMSGGTICDNIVYAANYDTNTKIVSWGSEIIECDVVAMESFQELSMTGGSLKSCYKGSTEPISVRGVSIELAVEVDNKSGIVVKAVNEGVEWGCKDVVTDGSGMIYVLSNSLVNKAYGYTPVSLKGEPVIEGSPTAGTTLTVSLSPTQNFKCEWFVRDTSEGVGTSVSHDTAYVVQKEDLGKQIYVVITGTNGYIGNLTSSSVTVYVLYAVVYVSEGDVTNLPPRKTYEYIGGTITLSDTIPTRENYYFIGWKSTNGVTYVSGGVFDPSRVFTPDMQSVTMTAVWESKSVTVYWDGGIHIDTVVADELSGDRVTYEIPEAPPGKVFVGWKNGSVLYATGQPLTSSSEVRNFEAVFIDETYHGTLIIGPVQSSPPSEESSSVEPPSEP